MTTTRYKQDAAYELTGIEARIRSTERSIKTTANAKTAAIGDAVLPSLLRQRAALRAEMAALPQRPERVFAYSAGNSACLTRDAVTEPFTAAELEALAIPEFLRRRV